MSMPPRQPRSVMAGGLPIRRGDAADNDSSLEKIAQRALDVSRAAVPYLPVVGPAYEMGEDIKNGNYRGALLNGAMLAADLSPLGPARRVVKLLDAVNDMKRGALLARAGTQTRRIRKIEKVGPGFEVHHTIPMAGWGKLVPKAERHVEGLYRNHPANLKVMDKATHRRLTGNWTDPATGQVLKRFNAAQRAWHGTNDLQKTTALAAGATVADWGENLSRSPAKAAVGNASDSRKARAQEPQPILDPKAPLDVRRTETGFVISNKRR